MISACTRPNRKGRTIFLARRKREREILADCLPCRMCEGKVLVFFSTGRIFVGVFSCAPQARKILACVPLARADRVFFCTSRVRTENFSVFPCAPQARTDFVVRFSLWQARAEEFNAESRRICDFPGCQVSSHLRFHGASSFIAFATIILRDVRSRRICHLRGARSRRD